MGCCREATFAGLELKQELTTQNVAALDDAKFSDAILKIDTFEWTERHKFAKSQ